MRDIEQFRLDEVFEISRIIKVEVSVKAITPTESSIIPVITKTKSNNLFIHCFEENNDKYKRHHTEHTLLCGWKSCTARATYR